MLQKITCYHTELSTATSMMCSQTKMCAMMKLFCSLDFMLIFTHTVKA
jgi:hypothetical protein